MNKFLQTTLITAVLSTGAMASTSSITGNIKIENELNINQDASNNGTLDFTPGGHGHIADDVTLSQWETIKLGQAEDAATEDLATINVTKDIITEISAEGENPATQSTTTYYQYKYIAGDGSVKYVWSSKDNATKDDADLISDIADTSSAAAISDYQSGWGLVQGMSGGTITGGTIDQMVNYRDSHNVDPLIDINADAKYEVSAGYSLNQDDRTLTLEDTNPEKVFMDGYTDDKRKILGKENSGGLFTPDITNPEVISKITDGTKNLGEISQNGLDPQKLSSQTEVKDYLYEWGVKMHKGSEDIAYEEREDNMIIEILAKTTPDQAVAIPAELGKGNGEIVVKMPVWDKNGTDPDYVTGQDGYVQNVTISGNLHNIGYENETLTFEVPKYDRDTQKTIDNIFELTGDNRYLKGTINFGTENRLNQFSSLNFNGENSIPGGVTNSHCRSIRAGEYDKETYEYTSSAIVPEGATLNILCREMHIEGNFVVKGVMNIGVPKTISDGTDVWEAGTLHDDVFSYTQDGNGVYSRTHTYPIDSTGKDLSSFPLTVTNAEFDYVTEVNGIVKYENHKYLFTGSYIWEVSGNKKTKNPTDYDLRVEGNSETGFYTSRNNMWNDHETRLVAAIFGTYHGR